MCYPGGRQETRRCANEAGADEDEASLDLEAGGHPGTGRLASGWLGTTALAMENTLAVGP